MENKQIYEYLIVTDYFGNLNAKTRLYFDFDENGYVYHYEREDTSDDNDLYKSKSFLSNDYFISIDLADRSIKEGKLTPGPELGEMEYDK